MANTFQQRLLLMLEYHLHLEHRMVQRLLGRFLSQGFLYDELTRACVCLTDDPVPKVIVLGRLSLYGEGASRLHDEIISIASEWIAPEGRGRSKLRPLTESEKKDVLQVLEDSLASSRLRDVPKAVAERFQGSASQDVEELLPHLEKRADELIERAKKKLLTRGEKEASDMKKLLEDQKTRILSQQQKTEGKHYEQLQFDFAIEEKQQLEADRRHWKKRLAELETEIVSEPERIKATYEIKAHRIEPVGLVYLSPVSS
jgi:hypothetical protein